MIPLNINDTTVHEKQESTQSFTIFHQFLFSRMFATFILSRESNEIEEIKLFTSDIFHIHPFTIMKQNLMKQVTSTEIMAKLMYCLFKVF